MPSFKKQRELIQGPNISFSLSGINRNLKVTNQFTKCKICMM